MWQLLNRRDSGNTEEGVLKLEFLLLDRNFADGQKRGKALHEVEKTQVIRHRDVIQMTSKLSFPW